MSNEPNGRMSRRSVMPVTAASAFPCRMHFRYSPATLQTGMSSSVPQRSPTRRCSCFDVETITGDYCSASNASRASTAYAASGAEWRRSLVKVLSSRALGSSPPIANSFRNLAWVACVGELPARAVRLLGAADAIQRAAGRSTPARVREQIDTETVLLRQELGEEAFAAAWNEGRAMTIDQAVRYALEEIDIDPGGPPT